MARAAASADTVIGSDSEFEAAAPGPRRGLVAPGAAQCSLKHGPAGASLLTRDGPP